MIIIICKRVRRFEYEFSCLEQWKFNYLIIKTYILSRLYKKIMKKTIISFLFTSFLVVPMFSLAISAPAPAKAEVDIWGDKSGIQEELGYEDTTESDPRIIAASIIKVLMTFLGIIAVALIIWGGFKWMTAGGNDEQVDEARKIIVTAVIGLIIILAAWALADWALSTIQEDILKS